MTKFTSSKNDYINTLSVGEPIDAYVSYDNCNLYLTSNNNLNRYSLVYDRNLSGPYDDVSVHSQLTVDVEKETISIDTFNMCASEDGTAFRTYMFDLSDISSMLRNKNPYEAMVIVNNWSEFHPKGNISFKPGEKFCFSDIETIHQIDHTDSFCFTIPFVAYELIKAVFPAFKNNH